MQAILVIRVYALLNRSKKVLVFLTISYALQTIATFVMSGLLSNKQALHEYVSPAIDSVTQNVNTNDPSGFWPCIRAMIVLPVAFDTILLFFALWAFIGHALEAKKLHGGWSINVLVRTLMADHLVHFFCNLTWLSLNLSVTYTSEFNGFSALFSGGFNIFTALVVAFGPRMVISLRATENKTRRGGVILGGNLSTIQSGVRAAYPVREGYGDRRQVPSD
ncbi:hypothetical protein BJ138DRAFT_1158473 [Hygrophoropsis aurantiaca]|uniref:Uncharacterized protein n=1 Tax=Hygrophoropsis aurantiaca TaxID=72124 RepID=A0ACB8A4Q4_9AGAM|nr:hypothetical protein BJ138DRAFT_1158473 [Hygrophoropsis aurantiaca]